jgi:hypothetical protein
LSGVLCLHDRIIFLSCSYPQNLKLSTVHTATNGIYDTNSNANLELPYVSEYHATQNGRVALRSILPFEFPHCNRMDFIEDLLYK